MAGEIPKFGADFEDGPACQRVLEAVNRSAAERRWVGVAEVQQAKFRLTAVQSCGAKLTLPSLIRKLPITLDTMRAIWRDVRAA